MKHLAVDAVVDPLFNYDKRISIERAWNAKWIRMRLKNRCKLGCELAGIGTKSPQVILQIIIYGQNTRIRR